MIETKIHEYIQQQRRLLELELRSEQDETSTTNAKEGIAEGEGHGAQETRSTRILRNLQVDHLGIGLLGRTVVQFSSASASDSSSKSNSNSLDDTQKDDQEGKGNGNRNDKERNSTPLLPAHRLTVGDEVEIVSKLSQVTPASLTDAPSKRNKAKAGVISEVTDTSISIALFDSHQHHSNTSNQNNSSSNDKGKQKSKKNSSNNKNSEDPTEDGTDLVGAGWILVPRSSIQVHQKLLTILDRLGKSGVNHEYAGRVIASIFEDADAEADANKNTQKTTNDAANTVHSPLMTPFNPNLDDSQIDAIQFALNGPQPVSLIHGPPGTGKTTTVAELIHQAVHVHKMRVLVTAPSNVAVDNVLERLVASHPATSTNMNTNMKQKNQNSNSKKNTSKLRAVRIGHPARIQPSILKYSLESLVQNADGTEIVNDIRSEMKAHLRVASNPKARNLEKRSAYREMKLLRKELRQREGRVVEELLGSAQVVLTTNVGAANRILDKFENSSSGPGAGKPFDLVIIDEAAQALGVSCWIPILRGRRVVLAGDHCQLPPTIKSRHREVQRELSKTLFEQIMVKGETVSRMLQVQYRMHRDIANWCSGAMYGGKLLSHDSVKGRTLSDLPYVTNDHESFGTEDSLLPTTMNASLLLVDTAGCDLFESVNGAGSRYNEGEADIVARHIQNLMDIGMEQKDIAVITPYNGQVEILRRLLLEDYPKLEIRSVDGFQGGEREAVVLSLVRSSDRGKGGIGFLADKRRLNVAVTRAKRQCAIVCDSDTVSQNGFLKDLVDWIEAHGEYLSAMEYIEDALVQPENVKTSVPDKSGNTQASLDADVEQCGKPLEAKNLDVNTYCSMRKEEINSLKDDLAERISFFAEIADIGEEMEVEVTCANAILDHVHFLCKEYELHLRMSEIVADHRVITICKNDSVPTEMKPAGTLDDIDTVSSQKDEDALEVQKVCQQLQEVHVEPKVSMTVTANKSERIINSVPIAKKGIGGVKQESSFNAGNINSLLGDLARERAARADKSLGMKINETSKKSKAKKGKKACGRKPKAKKSQSSEDKNDDDLDDLAFLDSQIEKVQTSHGRKIEASGNGYKSIVNGILIAKPKPKEKKRNTNAANALNSKIKSAQQSRKAKTKKKK